jgi:hypothetical protein
MPPATYVTSSARISPCGMYRYWLRRVWDPELPVLLVVMLNPSKADAQRDDQTIRRVVHFAKRDGYGGIVVVNLFAFRTTLPSHLAHCARSGINIVGAENNDAIIAAAEECDAVVVAWGTHAIAERRADEVVELLVGHFDRVMCFGHNGDLSPKHPARLGNDTPFIDWLPWSVAA